MEDNNVTSETKIIIYLGTYLSIHLYVSIQLHNLSHFVHMCMSVYIYNFGFKYCIHAFNAM